MTMHVRRTTVTAMAVLIACAPGRPLHSQAAADRMEALVQADRSAAASSWKLGLHGALLEASDRDGVLLLPGAPLVIGTADALRDLTDAPSPLSSKVTWDPLGLEISSDSSIALMWGVASLPPEAEAPATGRFVCMWQYSNATWKIAALVLQGPAFAYRGAEIATAAKTPTSPTLGKILPGRPGLRPVGCRQRRINRVSEVGRARSHDVRPPGIHHQRTGDDREGGGWTGDVVVGTRSGRRKPDRRSGVDRRRSGHLARGGRCDQDQVPDRVADTVRMGRSGSYLMRETPDLETFLRALNRPHAMLGAPGCSREHCRQDNTDTLKKKPGLRQQVRPAF